MTPRVFVTKRLYLKGIELLREKAEVDYHDDRRGLGREALIERCREKEGIVCQLTDRFSADVIEALDESVKVLANVAVGYDNIDVGAATRRGIVVTNTPGVLTEATADLAFTLLCAAARRLTEAERFLRDGKWGEWYIDLLCGRDIHGATLGVLGMGRIGQATARRAKGFGMRILYHNRSRLPERTERELGARFASRDELLAESDFLSVHLPLSPETRHALGAAEFAKMKPTAVLINTARGPVVDEEALVEALASGAIAAAGLDVYEDEPRVHPGLLERNNVVLAPHIGSATTATREKMCLTAAENCLAAVTGGRPPNIVNPKALED